MTTTITPTKINDSNNNNADSELTIKMIGKK